MVQSQTIHNESTTCHQKTQEREKNIVVRFSKESSKSRTSKDSHSTKEMASLEEKKDGQVRKRSDTEKTSQVESEIVFIPLIEEIKQRRRQEYLAKEKKAKEERERFVKEAAEKKAAEREETVNQAKRLILYRKPMCREINRALLVSECLRELDLQMKFQETAKALDEDQETEYVRWMKEDVAKYEEEKKQNAEKEFEKNRNYGILLKKQMEEQERFTKSREMEEFEAEKQDQIQTTKYLQEIKEFEMQELLNKKQKLRQFFKDAIEEKKEFNLKLQYEDEFEDKAIEIYQNASRKIKKMHKAIAVKEQEERDRRANAISETFGKSSLTTVKLSREKEEKSMQKALDEQEAEYLEKERARKERQERMRKERQDFQAETLMAKSKQLEEEKIMKGWEMMQRFKKVENDENMKVEEQKLNWNNKMEYASILKKIMDENEIQRRKDSALEGAGIMTKEIIEKENQRILNYAEEVLDESKGVRPLYPILKTIQETKKEMGLLKIQKKVEIAATPKKRRKGLLKCTKPVPEEKILYLQ